MEVTIIPVTSTRGTFPEKFSGMILWRNNFMAAASEEGRQQSNVLSASDHNLPSIIIPYDRMSQ